MEMWIAILGLLIASWQLHLQRKEIQKATHLERLKIAADIIRSEIELREKIISDEKAKTNRDWDTKIQPHIDKVNKVLRPSLRSVVNKIIGLHGGKIDELSSLPQHYLEND
jgi:hypothetical protein